MPANTGRVVAEVERFVGGGFAGQVYRVNLREIELDDGPIAGLETGRSYAIKILKPPSGFSCLFRDFLYFLAYQGAFSAQVNPAAMRVGVLWQKLIRRAAAERFGTENAVCDTYATFHDRDLHSFGEINEWVSGRIWKFEVDERLFERWQFEGPPPEDVQSPEYVHKKLFMRDLVALLHEMGAPELARQYEWWTCKSQPNALKRTSAGHSPSEGLTAIDFRAGLALLPMLPMSPADFWLILRGLSRGRIAQFDRPDMERFRRFIAERREQFADLQPALDELERHEPVYRRSLPDVTHHHVHLLTDASLRQSVREGAIVGWRNLGRIDDEHADRLRRAPVRFSLFYLVGLLPLLGRFVLRMWGHTQHRAHVKRCLTSFGYLWRAMRGARIETLIGWHRQGRTSDERALALVHRPVRYWIQRILVGWMPAKWHRAFTEPRWAWSRLREKISFVYHFLRTPAYREAWLLEQVRLGGEEGMLTEEEAEKISRQIKDPYIQKYLKSLAVHICTLPVTQVVSLAVALYVTVKLGKTWQESMAYAAGVLLAFQVMPISPGSLARGLYVDYLMIAERNFRSYWLAALVSHWKYIGYLGFPLQMVAHDPALARFMAGRWATGAVRFIPVFGEAGGLPEHAAFDVFFNLPLALKRSFKQQPLATAFKLGATLALVAFWLFLLAAFAYAAYAYFRG